MHLVTLVALSRALRWACVVPCHLIRSIVSQKTLNRCLMRTCSTKRSSRVHSRSKSRPTAHCSNPNSPQARAVASSYYRRPWGREKLPSLHQRPQTANENRHWKRQMVEWSPGVTRYPRAKSNNQCCHSQICSMSQTTTRDP